MIARGRVTHEEVFKALHEVATAAAAGVDPGHIAQLAATHCQALLDADGAGVRWLDAESSELRLLAAAARQPTDHPPVMPLHGSLVGRAVLAAASIVCDDYPAEIGALSWATNSGIESIVVVPLLVGARAVGAISVFSYTPRQFTDEERQLIELLGAAIGPALESARIAEVRGREAARLAALHSLAVAASGELGLSALADLASVEARTALGCDSATVVLWDDRDRVLRVVTSEVRYGLGSVVPEDSLAVYPCFRSGEPLVLLDYAAQRLPAPEDPDQEIPALVAAVPLTLDSRTIGCLVVANKEPRSFGDEDVGFMKLLAAQLSPVLEAARLRSEFQRSEDRLRSAYEFMSCGVMQGPLGAPLELNDAAVRILGPDAARISDRADAPNIRMWTEDGEELSPAQFPHRSVARSGVPLRGESFRIQVGCGDPVWIHGDVVPELDENGRTLSVVASFVDVTAMKTAEEALRASEALFKEAFENSAIGMHLSTVDTGKIILANPALHQMLGYAPGTLTGVEVTRLSRLGNDEAETRERRRRLIAGEVERLHHRRAVRTRDGRDITVEVRVGLVRDSRGNPRFTVAQLIDVTRQEGVEAVLRDEAERMVELVRAQTETYASDHDSDAIIEMLAEKARVLTGADGASVILLEGMEVVGGASSGEPGPWLTGEVLGPCLARDCAEQRETLISTDAAVDTRVNHRRAARAGTRSLAASPLVHSGRILGVLQVRSRRTAAFSEREAKTLELLAGLAAAAISRAEMISAIRRSQEQLSALLTAAPVIVSSISRDGTVRLAMGKGLSDLGVQPSDVVGTSIHGNGAQADVRDAVELALAGVTSVTVGHNPALGRDFETHYSPLRDESGAATAVIAVAFDVTDRLAAERELAESRARLSAVVANSPVITFAIDREGVVLLGEGAGMTRLGLTPGVAVGMNVFDLFAGVPVALDHINRGLSGESFEGVVHIEAFDADFDARYSPLYDGQGTIIGMSGLATDITDRVRAELAERENEAKSRLMAMMNHEVRTPLNSVLGFAELLTSGRGGDLNEKQRRYVLNIEVAGRHLLSLVNDSLDLARLDAEKMPIQLMDLELGPILDQAIGQVQPIAEARGIHLLAEAPPLLHVSADRRRLLQVLWNLLSNAIKHSPTGSTVLLAGCRVGGLVEISVADKGTGIPPDQLEKIFEEFHQVGPSQIEGTGLGLALCRRLVAAMGGSIRVDSQLGAGSTFTVTLRPGD